MSGQIVSASAYVNEVIELFRIEDERSRFVSAIEKPTSKRQRFDALIDFYRHAMPQIEAAGADHWGIDPYEVNWCNLFSPIEFWLWQDIRQEGLVFYPQFPIAGYFVDFANPVARVAIECDGAAFHTDTERDARRQRVIEGNGWSVRRITGSDCRTDIDDETREPGAARRFIRRIGRDFNLYSRRV